MRRRPLLRNGGDSRRAGGSGARARGAVRTGAVGSLAAGENQTTLGPRPSEHLGPILVHQVGVALREVHQFLRVAVEIEQTRPATVRLVDELPVAVSQAEQTE